MSKEERITGFLRKQYTDEKLAALLAHAQDGKLAYYSCCCFAGVATAHHALRGEMPADGSISAGSKSGHEDNDSWMAMSNAFCELGMDDEARRAKLIPLIKAEMARREALRPESPEQEEVTVTSLSAGLLA